MATPGFLPKAASSSSSSASPPSLAAAAAAAPAVGLLDLPPEVGEQILVALASAGSLRDVAALARACRSIYQNWFLQHDSDIGGGGDAAPAPAPASAAAGLWLSLLRSQYGKDSVPAQATLAAQTLRDLSSPHRMAPAFFGAWLDDNYWRRDESQDGALSTPFVWHLDSVWWFDVRATFAARRAGWTYTPYVRFRLTGRMSWFPGSLQMVVATAAKEPDTPSVTLCRRATATALDRLPRERWCTVFFPRAATVPVGSDGGVGDSGFRDVEVWLEDHSSTYKQGLVLDVYGLVASDAVAAAAATDVAEARGDVVVVVAEDGSATRRGAPAEEEGGDPDASGEGGGGAFRPPFHRLRIGGPVRRVLD